MKPFRRFPSYDLLINNAIASFTRFPFTQLSTVSGTIIAIILIQWNGNAGHDTLQKLLMICALGIPLFIALEAFAEMRAWKPLSRVLFQSAGLIPLLIYLISLPPAPFDRQGEMVRFILLLIAMHFMVAFLPYITRDEVNGFWQYNKSLFLRILISALYSAVMYIGLLIALIAARELFSLNIPDKRFFQLWALMAGTFNTWIFLAGIPSDLLALNKVEAYPLGLKIFTQYILLPLVGLYLVILYAYELKIILNWNWPKGWVSQLVLWFSAVGILSLLLLWPLRELSENRWIRTFTKWFFRALIPLVVMLFLAIFERVGVYGITVNRYLVIAMAVGLAVLVLYFVFGKSKDIRVIPVVICLIALLSAYGPWSAFSISRQSQQSRLEKLLAKHSLLNIPDKKPTTDISLDDRREMTSVISYLYNWHGLDTFSPWLPDSTLNSLKSMANIQHTLPDSVATMLGFVSAYTSPASLERGESFIYRYPDSTGIDIAGYSRMIYFSSGAQRESDSTRYYRINSDTISISLMHHPPVLKIGFPFDSSGSGKAMDFQLATPISTAMITLRDGNMSGNGFSLDTTIGNYRSKVIISHIWGCYKPDSIEVHSLNAIIFLK